MTNLENCPDCEHKISPEAVECPNCGRPLKRKPAAGGFSLTDPVHIIGLIVFIILIAWIIFNVTS